MASASLDIKFVMEPELLFRDKLNRRAFLKTKDIARERILNFLKKLKLKSEKGEVIRPSSKPISVRAKNREGRMHN